MNQPNAAPMEMEILGIEVNKAQHGWSCEVYMACFTHRQFTAERHVVKAYGRDGWTGWLGALSAVVAGVRAARREARRLAAMPGEHNLDMA